MEKSHPHEDTLRRAQTLRARRKKWVPLGKEPRPRLTLLVVAIVAAEFAAGLFFAASWLTR
jgi:hypothetical protein